LITPLTWAGARGIAGMSRMPMIPRTLGTRIPIPEFLAVAFKNQVLAAAAVSLSKTVATKPVHFGWLRRIYRQDRGLSAPSFAIFFGWLPPGVGFSASGRKQALWAARAAIRRRN